MEYYLTLLTDACLAAGFTDVSRRTIAASTLGIVTDQQLGNDINRSLALIRAAQVSPRRLGKIGSGAFVNGATLTFLEPVIEPFNDVRLQCVIAQ
ncbi:MAG TPA: hypothetical protein PKX78_03820 [Candidatus Woesebacteria bacterium]|nr:hypothetical protein [Candidatus Woesebacteria bacterium]